MVRVVDYETRRRAILSATINKYIKEAIPIASEDIAEDFELSSATIRNVFAELEEMGYLTHPYTSGGRIPTTKGYRCYVDSLILQAELLDEEKKSIIDEYKERTNKLEDVLDRTSEIISTITHYTGITSFLEWQDRFFYKGISFILNQPEFKDSQNIRHLIKMIEDKEQLLKLINLDFPEKVKIYLGEELSYPGIENCSLAVSSFQIKNIPSGRLAVLGPMRMEYSHIIPTLEYISDVVSEVLEKI